MDSGSDPLLMTASIPFTGYVPGQIINVNVEINNQSITRVNEVKVSLYKIINLTCQKPKQKTKLRYESTAEVSSESVPMTTKRTFDLKIKVPSLAPNILNCEVIDVKYMVEVKAKTSGLTSSPIIELPVVIGTVPLHENQDFNENLPAVSVLR